MKVTLSWINEFLDLTQSPEEIDEALTLAGLEVDGVESEFGDTVFEISLTPNLGHCMSILGVARELSAAFQIPLKGREFQSEEEGSPSPFSAAIESSEKCMRYGGLLVRDIKVAPSPDWLSRRLEACAIRPVNNVVDVGNYVMLEFGQPLHMFDANKLSGHQLNIRSAPSPGEMVTLDEEKRSYPKGTLLICDEAKPVAFAGVMGDSSSAVSETTTDLFIEAAYFIPEAVRWTSKQLNLRSDSSSRFERGVDPEGAPRALNRAAQLLGEIAGGKVAPGRVDVLARPFTPPLIECHTSRVNQLLGTTLTQGEVSALLERLDLKIVKEEEDHLLVRIPSYRHDLSGEIDLVEEVGRLYGFNNIPPHRPLHVSSTLTHAPLYLFEERMRQILMGQGLQELLTCDLISPDQAKETLESTLSAEALIHVLHPASIEQSVLRPTLLPNLLEVVRFNLDRQNNSLAAYEVGKIHMKDGENYLEEATAAIVLTGSANPFYFGGNEREVDFFDLKGHVEDLLSALGIEGAQFSSSHLHSFHPGQQARLKKGKITLGSLGQVHPSHLTPLGITQPVFFAQVSLSDLMELCPDSLAASALSTFPGSQRDWTITLKHDAPVGELLAAARELSSPLVESISLRALFQSEKLGHDRKNVTLRFTYRSFKKTLSFEDVEADHKVLIQEVAKKLTDHVLLE
ncbi:MAG: Phenylalanine--tRNA ligase beta subunit [Chlamydiae bacterium]|nr:Phenylalanine--tRNA ligase beta subunit [Chlamydiota bacterium]